MYAHGNPFKDGQTAFNIEGTFCVGDTIYVQSENALDTLIQELAMNRAYVLQENFNHQSQSTGFTANARHKVTRDEVLDYIFHEDKGDPIHIHVSTKFLEREKHSLTEPDIHETILSAASQRRDLKYYNRDTDLFEGRPLSRMRAFVRHGVEVPFTDWEVFEKQCSHYHAQDFIRAMAW